MHANLLELFGQIVQNVNHWKYEFHGTVLSSTTGECYVMMGSYALPWFNKTLCHIQAKTISGWISDVDSWVQCQITS